MTSSSAITGMSGSLIGSMAAQIPGRISALGQLLVAGGSAIGQAVNTRKAREEENRLYNYNKQASDKIYNESRQFLNSEYYRDPLSATGNKSLLKLRDEQRADNIEAMNNRAEASGATAENRLAAMKAENQTDSRLIASLLQNEDARRNRISQQQLALSQQHAADLRSVENQHSANIQNQYYQNAQSWQQWGSVLGDAISQWGAAAALDMKEKGEMTGQLLSLGR